MELRMRTATAAVLAIVVVAMLALVANHALQRPVSFDGAMNLQVAQSLAHGEGYVRHYEGVRAFPMEVQTNVPFVVPAALVFRVAGVGFAQSQLVNFAYLVSFLGLAFVVARRFFGTTVALAAVLACLLVPGFHVIGMNGWGELPALFWWLAGTFLLLGETGPAARTWRILAGGACLGLALSTKTVMLIGVGVTLGVYGVAWLLQGARQLRPAAFAVFAAVAGLALPLLLIEAWRFAALGSADAYSEWWRPQLSAILWQTGTTQAHASATGLSKSLAHFETLTGLLELPAPAVAAWLFLPLLATAVVLPRAPVPAHAKRMWAAFALLAAIYLVWWLQVTPDSHTRLRRIMIGLVAVQLAWACLLGFLQSTAGAKGSAPRRAGAAILAIALLLPQAALAWNFATRLEQLRRADTERLYRIFEAVRSLPAGAPLFAKGFLSAPTMALYSGRHVEDIDMFTAGELARLGTGYLLMDPPAVKDNRFALELRRYPQQAVFSDLGHEVYLVDFRHRQDPFSAAAHASAATRPAVDFTRQRYPFVYGMHAAGREGWRWATTDAEMLLRYDGQPAVFVAVHKPEKAYARKRPLSLQVSLDGCSLGAPRVIRPGGQILEFAIPPRCRPAAGNVRLQLASDNLLEREPRNLKQLSYVLKGAGFAAE